MGLLEGKVAIITGAGGGQGEATARLFAAEGAMVVLSDVTPGAAATAAAAIGPPHVGLDHDIRDEGAWQAVIDAAMSAFGRIDILVNNAGLLVAGGLNSVTPDDLRLAYDVNVVGAFIGMQKVTAVMTSPGGSIINIASSTALAGAPMIIPYSTSKWALRGLSKSAAVTLAPRGIRVNAILPGVVETPMVNAGLDPAAAARIKHGIPLGAPAEPEDIGWISVFLASDRARFMTGSELVADGGRSA